MRASSIPLLGATRPTQSQRPPVVLAVSVLAISALLLVLGLGLVGVAPGVAVGAIAAGGTTAVRA